MYVCVCIAGEGKGKRGGGRKKVLYLLGGLEGGYEKDSGEEEKGRGGGPVDSKHGGKMAWISYA